MLWNWDTIDACFLTSTWRITTQAMFAGTCIGVILLVVTLIFLRRAHKEYDAFLLRKHDRAQAAKGLAADEGPGGVYCPTALEQAVRALLYTLQFANAYFVMLLAMYYNGYIIICIFIGAFLGSFVFTWDTLRR
ncbi:Ctr copper transporter family protein [Apiospora sp. TS-2023a]